MRARARQQFAQSPFTGSLRLPTRKTLWVQPSGGTVCKLNRRKGKQDAWVVGPTWVPPTSAQFGHTLVLMSRVSAEEPSYIYVLDIEITTPLLPLPCIIARARPPISRLGNSQGHRTLLRQLREISRIAHSAFFVHRVESEKIRKLEWVV